MLNVSVKRNPIQKTKNNTKIITIALTKPQFQGEEYNFSIDPYDLNPLILNKMYISIPSIMRSMGIEKI